MDWGDIQSTTTGLLNRRDATSTQITSWLTMGIAKIQRELRCPAMEKTVVVTIDGTYNAGLIIPTDFLELQYLMNSQGERIEKEDITTVSQLAGASYLASTGDVYNPTYDYPRFYVRTGGKWLLGPTPVLNDSVTMLYYANLPSLVNPTDSCALTVIAGDLFVYAGLVYAGDFFTDKRAGKWEARYEQIKGDLQAQADDDELSGSSAVSQAIHFPDDYMDIF